MTLFGRKRKERVIDEETKRCIKRNVINYLKRSAPGIYTSLNKYYLMKFNKEFIELLLEEPGKCYQTLIVYFGNPDSAEYFIYCLLERIFSFNPFYTSTALIALKEGNDDEFKRLIMATSSGNMQATIL